MLPKFNNPRGIQDYLDGLPYNTTDRTFCPRDVVLEQKAHCMDGAVFAATALESLGYPPLLVDLRAIDDDDHVIAVFRENGLWGAVAKSNTTTLRFRDPAYRSIRELALSYFPVYFNTDGEMSLYEYSRPFSLRKYRGAGAGCRLHWAGPGQHSALSNRFPATAQIDAHRTAISCRFLFRRGRLGRAVQEVIPRKSRYARSRRFAASGGFGDGWPSDNGVRRAMV